jgi:putative membrane protein
VGGTLGGVAYTRWARAERAMRQETDLPLSLLLPFLALFTAVLAVGLAAIIVIFG